MTGRRYHAVIFDLDGTLIDSERIFVDAGLAAFAAMGWPEDRDAMHLTVGVVDHEARRLLGAHLGPDFDFPGFEILWRQGIREAYDRGIPLRPGVAQLLDRLSAQDHPRAVATNTLRANALTKLAGSGIGHHFDPLHVVGADIVAAPKPAPDVFLLAADRLGADPSRCLAVEDSEPGVAAALAAGMTVLHVPDMKPGGNTGAHYSAASLLEGAALARLFD